MPITSSIVRRSRATCCMLEQSAAKWFAPGSPMLRVRDAPNAERQRPGESRSGPVRAGPHSAELEVELTQPSIPFVKIGGLHFRDAAHVKDVPSMLQFAENPRDRMWPFGFCRSCPGSDRPRQRRGPRCLTDDNLPCLVVPCRARGARGGCLGPFAAVLGTNDDSGLSPVVVLAYPERQPLRQGKG